MRYLTEGKAWRYLTEGEAWRQIAKKIEEGVVSNTDPSRLIAGLCWQIQYERVEDVVEMRMKQRVRLFQPFLFDVFFDSFYWPPLHEGQVEDNFDCRVIAAGLLAAMADAGEPVE